MSINSEDEIRRSRKILQNQYAYLAEDGSYAADVGLVPKIAVSKLLGDKRQDDYFSKSDIEVIAKRLQREMWFQRNEMLPNLEEIEPADILNPMMALTALGFRTHIEETLGQYRGNGDAFEVAGIFSRSTTEVWISRRFALPIRNFTAAHELGHAILHAASTMHRDRPLDGSPSAYGRDAQEIEADLFASYFLMPQKVVQMEFRRRFLTTEFRLNETSAFALAESLQSLQNKCRTLRDFTRILAGATYYNSVHFSSLAEAFCVSTEAMAIRLEELDFVVC